MPKEIPPDYKPIEVEHDIRGTLTINDQGIVWFNSDAGRCILRICGFPELEATGIAMIDVRLCADGTWRASQS